METVYVALQIAGSVALLLFGLSLIRSGMEEAFGMRLKMGLGFGTRTGPRAFLAGLIATLGLQSSTAAALLTSGFVARRMIDPQKAQIVLLGANLGTALTALVVASGPEALAPVLILLGYALRGRSNPVLSGCGAAGLGIGLLLISLVLLTEATLPIRDSAALAVFLTMLDGALPVALVLVAGVAVLCSSSLAAVLLVLSLPTGPELTLAMVLGANLGGALPPVLASLRLGPAARRLTLGNLAVRSIGCLAVLPFITPLAELLQDLPRPRSGLAVEAHLAFNLLLAALVWPLLPALSRVLARLVPEEEPRASEADSWLDESLLSTPALALGCAASEVLAIGVLAERMLAETRSAFAGHDTSHLAMVSELESRIDRRQTAVKGYLSRLGDGASEAERRRTISLLDYAINIEHIGDIIDKGLGPAVRKKVGLNLRFSDEGFQELERMFLMTQEGLRMAQSVFMTGDRDLARRLVELKVEIRNFERQSSQKHLMRLRDGGQDSRETSSLHLDLLRDLKRIVAHTVSVAYPILDEEGLLIESRLRAERKDGPQPAGG